LAKIKYKEEMMYFKRIEGKKCYLSPISIDDAEKYCEWLNDNEITKNLKIYNQIFTIQKEKELLRALSDDNNFAIIDSLNNKLIGNCGFFDVCHLNRHAEVGIFIGDKNYHNKGFGTEALSLLLHFGFSALNLHNVLISTYEYNLGALKCYKKIGFKTMGTRREATIRDLKKHNEIWMDILPDEFYDIFNKGDE
jgi:RimJ/RimL family protein N-acetyltransferase